jgi:7-cyano-7-deazaguanine synthase
MTRAIVLLSGGLDSAVALAQTARDHHVTALTFDYGQRNRFELACARMLADRYDANHVTLNLDLFGGSPLTTDDIKPADPLTGVSGAYVAGRNTIMLAHALALAEQRDVSTIVVGVNGDDQAGFPDCRPGYLAAFALAATLAAGRTVRLTAPLIDFDKGQVVRAGHVIGVDYRMTSSCYQPDGETSCRRCDACLLRSAGFAQAGIQDPGR